MKRLATLMLMAGFTVSSLIGMGQGASATPFSDIPANHWAYQAIQSLAADGLVEGYPDGKFKGDRPLTRYEMAVIVARVIAKVQANGADAASKFATKADLDKLQKLIDSLRDELDSLGVRVTNVEDALDALDKRTKFAQSIEFHGSMLLQNTDRERYVLPKTVTGGNNGDAFVTAFISSPANNSPLEQQGPGTLIRQDDKLNFIYHVTEDLQVSLPFHLITYGYGGEFTQQNQSVLNPDVVIRVKRAGALTNMVFRVGQLDDLPSSRTGLTYRAPDASQQGPGLENPIQPYQKGLEFKTTLNGLTDVSFAFSRLDQTYLNTLNTIPDPSGDYGVNNYFFYTNRPQTGLIQQGPPGSTAGSLRSQTFSAGNGALGNVFLSAQAVAGTVFVSGYNGNVFNNTGAAVGGTGTAPTFVFNVSLNQVVFNPALPAGSQVTITYVGLGYNNNSQTQRYEFNARVNQKIKGLPGAEVGVSFNRVYDQDNLIVSGPVSNFQNAALGNGANGEGYGLVSDTVFGIDAQVPLPFSLGNKQPAPVLFGEVAGSKFTNDVRNVAATTDTAAVVGARLKYYNVTGTLQYQAVGVNFFDGAPFRYFGNAPPTFSFYKLPYVPQFFGFGNTLAINREFDNQFPTGKSPNTAGNATLSYIYPLFNPFAASGPSFFSAFTPNTQGFTGNIAAPVRIGDTTVNTRFLAQALQEIRPNSFGAMQFGSAYTSNVRETYNKYEAGAGFSVPIFAKKVAFNLTGTYDQLSRNDKTGYQYYPFNPNTQSFDGSSVGSAAAVLTAATGGAYGAGSRVSFFPNYVNVKHYTGAVNAAIPLTTNVVLALDYNSQRYGGTYGTTLGQSLDQRKDQYQGSLTYSVPNTTSQIVFIERQNKYIDNVVPSYNFTQVRTDLNFVVRF